MGVFPGAEFPDIPRLTPVRELPVIRLDRAQKMTVTKAANAAQFGEIELNNNAPQNAIIVVRAIAFGPVAAVPIQSRYVQQTYGGSIGTLWPLVPDRGVLPGKIQTAFLNALPATDWVFWAQSQPTQPSDFWPVAVLPSGWSVRFVTQTVNQAWTLSLLWETLSPEQYTESYGSYA
jgi:hypothetical protein